MGWWQWTLRWLGCVSLAAILLLPDSGMVQAAPPPAPRASLSHSAAKGVTQRIASTLKKAIIFSLGTGSFAAGGALTVLTSASSYAIYVANDYLWDKYSPPSRAPGKAQEFDVSGSFRQSAMKYLTLKPIGMAATWGVIYAYTGSWTATLAMGGLSSLLGPVIFFGNNTAWDWYDWYTAPAAPDAPAEPPHQPVIIGAR